MCINTLRWNTAQDSHAVVHVHKFCVHLISSWSSELHWEGGLLRGSAAGVAPGRVRLAVPLLSTLQAVYVFLQFGLPALIVALIECIDFAGLRDLIAHSAVSTCHSNKAVETCFEEFSAYGMTGKADGIKPTMHGSLLPQRQLLHLLVHMHKPWLPHVKTAILAGQVHMWPTLMSRCDMMNSPTMLSYVKPKVPLPIVSTNTVADE